mmetsp:Transcript_24437/g.60634  ORF Transcript_24437/g.60634 Transcript_24437/m.60634 type:complete len:93 (+) Transcript_24437:26-304(+)
MSSWAASKALMELRVHLCQTSPASSGVRAFWANKYHEVKSANLKLPILIREFEGTAAKLTATYEFGKEKSVAVDGMGESEFGDALAKLMKGP